MERNYKSKEIESWFNQQREVNVLDKVLSIIYADTYDDNWGSTIEIFGVADNEKDVDKICKTVEKDGYYPQVEEITLNEYCRRYLGGYYE